MRILLTILLLVSTHNTQLPEYGDISDLKGMRKVYVTADSTQSRKYILEEIKHYAALEVVGSVDAADFVIECKRLTEEGYPVAGIVRMPGEFEMKVYTIREGRQRIAWSKTKMSQRPAPKLLTGDFIGALKKSQKANR